MRERGSREGGRERHGGFETERQKDRGMEKENEGKSFHSVVNRIRVIHPSLGAAAQSKSPGSEAAGGAQCGAWGGGGAR